jgi:type II secretory pathway predicted ATPase ExeA/septal ring-binding cell division protein DamX
VYHDFFGLKQPPFRITPDTEFFFEGANRGAVLEALTYAILHGEGIVKVTGEVGSGKTMLCRVLQARLAERVDIVYLANPSVSPEEILHAIAFELQLPVPRDAKRLEVMHALQDYLLRRHAEGRQVVVFVEESQGMPLATLEEIRLLSNLETDRDKLLQLVLFGQPELDENLRRNSIRQLRERITHSFYLSPLAESDIRAYLTFRLHAAGYRGPELFLPKVVSFMARASGGLTRRVNLIADKALLAAYAANTHTVTLEHVKVAVRDSEFSQGEAAPAPQDRPRKLALLGLAIAAVAAAAVIAWLLLHRDNPPEGAASAPVPGAPPANPAPATADAPPAAAPSPPTAPAPSPPTAAAPSPPTAPATSEAAATPATPGNGLRLDAELAPGANPGSADAPAPAAKSERRELPADFLERRLLATEAWLARQPEQAMTVQVLGSNDSQLLRTHLRLIAKYIDTERIFVFCTRTGIGPTLTVLVGSYATRNGALAALDGLPEELKLNRPYLRTVRGVRAEIEATAAAATSG